MLKKIKKAAMFGLDFEPLKKQFGELFLVKRQSEAPNGANGSCGKGRIALLKHAAMFGLDARVALAIFGALSVVTFASIYRTIDSANANLYMQELKNIKQAFYTFKQDTGIKLPKTTNSYYYNASALINTSVDNNIPYTKKYNGPYLNYNVISQNTIKAPGIPENIKIVSRSNSDDWSTQAIDGSEACSANDCAVFASIENINSELALTIKEDIDGETTSNDKGLIRLIQNGSTYNIYYHIGKE